MYKHANETDCKNGNIIAHGHCGPSMPGWPSWLIWPRWHDTCLYTQSYVVQLMNVFDSHLPALKCHMVATVFTLKHATVQMFIIPPQSIPKQGKSQGKHQSRLNGLSQLKLTDSAHAIYSPSSSSSALLRRALVQIGSPCPSRPSRLSPECQGLLAATHLC